MSIMTTTTAAAVSELAAAADGPLTEPVAAHCAQCAQAAAEAARRLAAVALAAAQYPPPYATHMDLFAAERLLEQLAGVVEQLEQQIAPGA